MTSSLTDWADEVLTEAVTQALQQVTIDTATEIRRRTHARRTLTRAGVYGVMQTRTSAEVGIRFARRYAGNTPTGRRFRQLSQLMRPRIRTALTRLLNLELQDR